MTQDVGIVCWGTGPGDETSVYSIVLPLREALMVFRSGGEPRGIKPHIIQPFHDEWDAAVAASRRAHT